MKTPRVLKSLTQFCMPEELRDSGQREALQIRMAILFAVSGMIFSVIFSVLEFVTVPTPYLGLLSLLPMPFAVLILILARRGASPAASGHVFAFGTLVVIWIITLMRGGFMAPALNWCVVAGVVSVMLCGRRAGLIWTTISAVGVVAALVVTRWQVPWVVDVAPQHHDLLRLVTLIGVQYMCLSLCVCYEAMQELSEVAVVEEKTSLRQLLHWQEVEKQMLAYDLHDGPVQLMAAALMKLDTVIDTANGQSGALQDARDTLSQAVTESRRLIGGLRPEVLEEQGLVRAIEDVVDQHSTVAVEFKHNLQQERMLPVVESTLFRICQESLTNAAKYSQAQRVQIDLSRDDHSVRLLVHDDGIGFSTERRDNNGFGLVGIRQRARFLGGTAAVESQPGSGTTIAVRLPLNAEE